MKKFLERCAGIDIGKRELTATILMGPPNQEPQKQTRTFAKTMAALMECRERLLAGDCLTVVMESTGSYWVPVWNVQQEAIAIIVAIPGHVKARRGEKTDPEDSRQLAERLRVGGVRGSFVPREQVQHLRDLIRRRKRLLGNAKQRETELAGTARLDAGYFASDPQGTALRCHQSKAMYDSAVFAVQPQTHLAGHLIRHHAEVVEGRGGWPWRTCVRAGTGMIKLVAAAQLSLV